MLVQLWRFSVSLLLIFLIPSPTSISAAGDMTAYEVLRSYDFPQGLLPKGVTGYELDESTGKFSARLNGSCSFSISGYDLKYNSRITGVITKGKLRNLKGVSVKVVLFWVNIVEVVRIEEGLEFSVGIASADFPIDSFVESPTCGCGFDCNTVVGSGDRDGVLFGSS